MANTLFDSCSAIMYAGVYTGDSSTQGTLYSIIPNSTTGDFKYTGSVGITGSSRINSSLNFTEFTTNATPRIDYSYTSESFAFISSSADYSSRTISSSIIPGTTIGNLILEGETNNNFITPIDFFAFQTNTVTSSLSKFPTEGNYNYNVVSFQENDNGSQARYIDFLFDYGITTDKVAKLSFCVSGGLPFTSTTSDKARTMNIQGNQFDFRNLKEDTGVAEFTIINPSEYSSSKTNADSASIFVRTGLDNLEVTDIGDGWLRLSQIGRITGGVGGSGGTADKMRIRYVATSGDPTGNLVSPGNSTGGSGSAPFTDNDPSNFTSSIAVFSIANLQLELIEGDITSSLSGSSGGAGDGRNSLAFMPATSYVPTSASAVTKPAESLELPLTSSTVSSILTNHNQGTIITRFAWTPVSGSDEASSNHFALLKTGSASTTDFLRIDGRGIYYRNEAGALAALSTGSAQVPHLRQSGSLFPSTYHNYAFTWSGSAMSCSIDSGSIITTSTNIWTGSAAEQLEYIGGVMGISDHTQVRLQYIMVSPHKFDANALKNATTGSIV